MGARSAARGGYSDRIHDPAFKRYVRHANYWALLFAGILAVVAVVGFFIYGETSSEMDNPQALYIGLGIGGMFLTIALITVLGRATSKTWDGVVVDKYVKRRRRRAVRRRHVRGALRRVRRRDPRPAGQDPYPDRRRR